MHCHHSKKDAIVPFLSNLQSTLKHGPLIPCGDGPLNTN